MNELFFQYLPLLLFFIGAGLLGYASFEAVNLGYKKYKESYERKVSGELQKNFLAYSPEDFYKLNIVSTLGLGVIGYVVFNSFVMACFFAALGYFIPKLFLMATAKKRAEKLELQLIDALHVLANSVSAGLTLTQACEVVVKQLTPPVSQEFGLLVNENRLGVPLDQAMENMAKRIKSNNFDLLVTSIVIARQTGGNIAEIFKQLAESIKEIMRLEGKVKALTAQGKMQGFVLGGLPFGITAIMYGISPEMISPLFTTVQGSFILILAFIFWAIGIYLVRKVINVDI
jgi:tight adherence protein B